MTDKLNLQELVRRAFQSEIDMGVGEAIINKQSDRMQADILVDSNSAVSESFGSLEEHFNQICNCQKCALGKSRNKFVYGIGNPNADILFIGEAPGANEDLQGEPFVGRAGELLDKILAAIQLSRQTVYIANILKCRPPGNRDPLPEERELCFPYLYKQINLIKPKFICTLGLVASQELLQTKEPLGRLRKNWQNFRGIPVLVTYHPAALLRFPKYKRDTWEDMKKLKARYESMR